jgi:short-subunit dehydrogenase
MTANRKTALITGASGGIGEALARVLAQHGYDLILVARTASKLEALGAELSAKNGIQTTSISSDLSAFDASQKLMTELETRKLNVDVLVNNAGFGEYGEFATGDPVKQQQMISLNIMTLTMLTRALLPKMLEHKFGRVMNVASTAAFMPGPLMSVYYASKAYVLSFSEALGEELLGTGVSVTALCPGPTESDFQARAAMQESKLVQGKTLMTSREVAEQGVAALERGQRVVIPGIINQIQAQVSRFLPRAIVPGIIKNIQGRNH